MRTVIRHLGTAAALLLAGVAAHAGDVNIATIPDPPDASADGGLIVGVGVICNTGAQAEHYMRLRVDGTPLQPAVTTVNERAHEPSACGMAAIAFRLDKTMDTQSIHGRLVSIVRISVMAGYDGTRWAPVPPLVQYAVMEEDGYAI